MGLYEVLKAAKIGAASDVLTTLRGQQAPFAKGGSSPTEHEYTGAVPYTFSANGEPLLDWYIKGNVGGVGDRTANLFDKDNPVVYIGFYNTATNMFAYNNNNAFVVLPIAENITYYVTGIKRASASISVRWCTSDVFPSSYIQAIRTGTFAQTDVLTITANASEKYLALFVCGDSDYNMYDSVNAAVSANCDNLTVDNGYKIQVVCGGQTTNIYIDEPLGTSDSISMTSTGVSIPTANGSNTLSVGTTVQPSEVYIKWKG